MRRNTKKIILNCCYIVIGIVLIILSAQGVIGAIYNGFGAGLVGAGAVLLYKHILYMKDPAYREKTDIEIADERNSYIRVKAWSWAGYLFVLISAVVTIVSMVMDKREMMIMASGGVCLMLILYVGSYYILRRKY